MFLGHVNDIQLNSYLVLEQFNKRKVLAYNIDYKLISNICPHQQSLISIKSGSGNRICSYHGWSFDNNGNSLGSGTTSCKNTQPLEQTNVYNWNGLLFSEPINLDFDVDLSHMKLIESRIDIVNADQRNVMDLFLDVDHIPLVHKGVYDKIGLPNIRNVNWKYFDNGSLQIVDRNSDSFNSHLIDSERVQGAFWLALYPNTMIEWQPGSLFITVTLGNKKVLVYKYKDTRYTDESYKMNEDVWETAWHQDKSQAEIITEFTYSNLCDAKTHYRSFLNGTS